YNVLLIAISLDPLNFQHSDVELPLWQWSLGYCGTLDAEDLIGGHRFKWTGKLQSISLNPEVLPYAIWRICSREA
ncbi:hypothetical protein ACC763_38230, partial [Rhizobium ruizarguesonis]